MNQGAACVVCIQGCGCRGCYTDLIRAGSGQWGAGSGRQAVPPAASDWKKQQFDFDVQPKNKTLDQGSQTDP